MSVRGSIRYAVLPGLRRAEVLADPAVCATVRPLDVPDGDTGWWLVRTDRSRTVSRPAPTDQRGEPA